MNIEEVADNTYRLEAPIPKVNATFTVYFIDDAQGVVIEPGPTSTIPAIQEAMKLLGMKELAYIIPTHIHIDHAGAIGSLARLFPHAKVVLHPAAVKHAVNPSRLIESTRMSFGDDFEIRYGPILPVPESQVKVPEDGETVSIDGRELQIIYAPGHAAHHMAIFDLKTRGLFCGEALGLPMRGAKSLPLPAASPPGFDVDTYLETIKRLKELDAQILFYSHDGVGRQPEHLISRVLETTHAFSDIILKALREGETTEAIVQKVREYCSNSLDLNVEKGFMRITIDGFIFYFKKKGLV